MRPHPLRNLETLPRVTWFRRRAGESVEVYVKRIPPFMLPSVMIKRANATVYIGRTPGVADTDFLRLAVPQLREVLDKYGFFLYSPTDGRRSRVYRKLFARYGIPVNEINRGWVVGDVERMLNDVVDFFYDKYSSIPTEGPAEARELVNAAFDKLERLDFEDARQLVQRAVDAATDAAPVPDSYLELEHELFVVEDMGLTRLHSPLQDDPADPAAANPADPDLFSRGARTKVTR
jgi:hypothetical protein